jgi:hypothetical protein
MALHAATSIGLVGLTSLQSAMSIPHGDPRCFAITEKDLEMAVAVAPQGGMFARDSKTMLGCSVAEDEHANTRRSVYSVRSCCMRAMNRPASNDEDYSEVHTERSDPTLVPKSVNW